MSIGRDPTPFNISFCAMASAWDQLRLDRPLETTVPEVMHLIPVLAIRLPNLSTGVTWWRGRQVRVVCLGNLLISHYGDSSAHVTIHSRNFGTFCTDRCRECLISGNNLVGHSQRLTK